MKNRNGRKTACPKGHEYNEANSYFYTDAQGYEHRHCRVCRRKRLADLPLAESRDEYGKTFYSWQTWGAV